MKSKLVFAALLFGMAFTPAHLFAANCFHKQNGGMFCDDGRHYNQAPNGNLHGSDGSTYHRDYYGNYHGNDGSFVPRGGGAVTGGNQRGYGNQFGGGNQFGNQYGGGSFDDDDDGW